MILEELIEPAPIDVERLRARQDAERQARNVTNVEAWYELGFGPIVGPQLARGHQIMLGACGFDGVVPNSKRIRS